MKHRSHLSLSSPAFSKSEGRTDNQNLASDPSADVDKCVETAELETAVKAAIGALPEDEQLVVVLKEYQGLNYSEIAEITKRPVGTLRSINHRAHERLRAALAPYLGE